VTVQLCPERINLLPPPSRLKIISVYRVANAYLDVIVEQNTRATHDHVNLTSVVHQHVYQPLASEIIVSDKREGAALSVLQPCEHAA
jgi:hypothetical protein